MDIQGGSLTVANLADVTPEWLLLTRTGRVQRSKNLEITVI